MTPRAPAAHPALEVARSAASGVAAGPREGARGASREAAGWRPAIGDDGEPVFFGAPELNRSDPRVLAQTYVTYLATRALRQDAAHLIAIAAVGLWLLAAWPDRFSKALREDILIVWLFLVAGGIILRIVEWRRRVEFRRCMLAQTSESKGDREATAR